MIHRFYKTQSKLATILIGFDAGAKFETKYKYNYGVAHALEHNIFKHYNGLNSIEISKKISMLGGSTNAYTSSNYVAYYIELPLEYLRQGLDILKGMVSDCIVEKDDFLNEMEIIKEEEIGGRQGPSGEMWKTFRENYFSNHLKIPVIGTQESISNITLEEIQDFHGRFCNFDQSVVCMSANMTKKDAMSMLRDVFGKQSGKISRVKMPKSKYKKSREVVFSREDMEQTIVWMGMPNKTYEDVSAEAYLIHSMLSRGMDSRLYEEVREKRGLVYSISSSFNDYTSANFNMFSFQTRYKNKDEVISIINDEISDIQNNGFNEDELTRAKNKAKTHFYKLTETGSGMVHNIFSSIIENEPSIDKFMNKVDGLTNEDLTYAANVMFDTDKCLQVICKGE
jgi:predicted Zn-dependent peptidase